MFFFFFFKEYGCFTYYKGFYLGHYFCVHSCKGAHNWWELIPGKVLTITAFGRESPPPPARLHLGMLLLCSPHLRPEDRDHRASRGTCSPVTFWPFGLATASSILLPSQYFGWASMLRAFPPFHEFLLMLMMLSSALPSSGKREMLRHHPSLSCS